MIYFFEDLSILQLSETEEKSRRFSKLPPAAKNDPNAARIGHFAITKTPEFQTKSENEEDQIMTLAALVPEITDNQNELVLSPGSLAVNNSEKSRRFSKLPPADKDSPNAVKLGSKFTMISREDEKKDETVQK